MSLLTEYHNCFLETQQKYGEKSVVLMAVGSFYEMYSQNNEYLKKICNILNVLLTKKNKPLRDDITCLIISGHQN